MRVGLRRLEPVVAQHPERGLGLFYCPMPYKSDAQRRFFHTATARSKGITSKDVAEFDRASKGRDLPERVTKRKVSKGRSLRGRR